MSDGIFEETTGSGFLGGAAHFYDTYETKDQKYISIAAPEKVFKTRSRDEWCEELEGTDVCFAPVLALGEVAGHRHNKARNAFVNVGGEPQPAPAPRFSLTSNDTPSPAPQPGRDTERLLRSLGYSDAEIAELKDAY